jgi:hypothetical protein
MEKKFKDAIEEYQCSGCMKGGDISCFKVNEAGGIGCGNHYAGTMISGIGKIFLGMPKGFNRLGEQSGLVPNIFRSFESSSWGYDNKFNRPVWKHLTKDGHTLVRGLMPRKNEPFLHIYLENCLDKIDCLEITEEDINQMD